jgi:hypothetical protein
VIVALNVRVLSSAGPVNFIPVFQCYVVLSDEYGFTFIRLKRLECTDNLCLNARSWALIHCSPGCSSTYNRR